jgi:hypothetical protein
MVQENLRGSVPQRVINVLHGARKKIAAGENIEEERIWGEAAEAELIRQGVEVPSEDQAEGQAGSVAEESAKPKPRRKRSGGKGR